MTFISYAPNREDVPLWRALNDIVTGVYVDCGSNPAESASVTQAFYDRGWRGVVLRPAPHQGSPFAANRPRDIVLAGGDLAGLAVNLPAFVHFARIDADDAQTSRVLQIVLSAQPWIVLIRAGNLASDAALASARYRCLLYDGLNRFFLSADQSSRAERLAAPANARDNYVSAADDGFATRLAAAEAALEIAQMRVDGRARQLTDAVRSAGQARSDLRAMAEGAAWLRHLADEALDGQAKLRAEAAWLREQLVTERERQAADRSELLGQLLLRADQATWLRECLANSEAQLHAERILTAHAEHRAQLAEAAIANSRVLRAARVLRGKPRQTPAPLPQRLAEPPAVAVAMAATTGLAVAPTPEEDPVPPVAPLSEPTPVPTQPAGKPTGPPSPSPVSQPVTTVHQFHAGSAVGDAITNAMLLIRTLLRAQGFHSEIFVQSRADGLEREIHLMAAMPRHAGMVLLVHHSMGFPGFEDVLTLPSRKVLIYHNITPPPLLEAVPHVERMAVVGREQLATWRDHVVFALADSEYNAVELHALGFAAVRTCTLLFDVDALVARAAGARYGDDAFTVLFVGRVTPAKAQHDLVEAFALFRRRLGRRCRLVMVGALNPDEHRYLEALDDRIGALGLEADVQLTGLISDAELHGWYLQADLYVSLSHHEGFGVPLVEAMAYGVPVLAWPTGAVPYTLDGAGVLLSSREPAAVATEMLAGAARGRSGPVATLTGRWALGRQLPILLEALAAAGAVPPAAAATRARLASNVRMTIAGQFDGAAGLAPMNRSLARIVEAQRPGSVRLLMIEDERSSGFLEADLPFIRALAARPDHESGPVLVLSGCDPPFVPAARGDLLAALLSCDETLIPAALVATLNAQFDAVLVASRFVAKALVDSGVSVPVLNLGQATDHLKHYAALPLHRRHDGPFTFLHVSQASTGKGLEVLLAAWRRGFTGSDSVQLVVQTFPHSRDIAAALVDAMRAECPDAAPVVLLDAEMTPGRSLALYRDADAAVLPSRGEDHNLAAAEAMAAGLPLIVTGFGSHLDSCGPDTARLVARRFAPSGSATPHALCAEPDVDDLTAALREVRAGGGAARVDAARAAIIAATNPVEFTNRLAAAPAALLLAPKRPAMRVVWVTSWRVRCGIAEYSRTLLEALPRDRVADLTILADERSEAGNGVDCAWRLGDDAGNPDRLATAIARADADVVMIQHQPGLLPWPVLAALLDNLAGRTSRRRAILLTLHNTRHLLALDAAERGVVVASLRRVARILVHTPADLALLDGLGLIDQATLLPHPAPRANPSIAPVREMPPDAAPLVGSTGFFLPDKGLRPLITAVASLRGRWSGIRLRLVNAAYEDPASAAEIAACRQLAAAEGMAVEWHTGFIPLAEQTELLLGCDLVVLPYQRSLEASSAALRTALGSGAPVAVTPLPLFEEAGDAVCRLPGCDPHSLATGIAEVLENACMRRALQDATGEWLSTRAVSDVASRLHGLMLGLAAACAVDAPLDGSIWEQAVS